MPQNDLPKWTAPALEPRSSDVSSAWSPEQLARMDSDFCTRVRITLRSGRESLKAATATYDLPARRP